MGKTKKKTINYIVIDKYEDKGIAECSDKKEIETAVENMVADGTCLEDIELYEVKRKAHIKLDIQV